MATKIVVVLALLWPPDGPPCAEIDLPSTAGAVAPHLAPAADDVVLTWLEPAPGDDDRYRLRFARTSEEGWSEPVTVAERGDFFVNWADVPSAVEAADGTLLAHWLQKSGEPTYAYDVRLARSIDRGRSWRPLGPVHFDRTETEHGFVSFAAESGGVRAFWLDGREMAVGTGGTGDMALRTALIRESVEPSSVLDPRVCECCGTSAALTSRGPVIVYRDRSAEEIRDISIVRRLEGGWTEPRPVHVDGWRIAACPVNGPAAAARGSHLVVVWYTGATDRGAVRAVFSSDAGESFGEPITVDDTWPAGRVGVVLDDSGDAIVCWLDAVADRGAIMLRRLAPDGRMGGALKIADSSVARASGFPVMVRRGDRLLIVWTQLEPRGLQGMTLPVARVPSP